MMLELCSSHQNVLSNLKYKQGMEAQKELSCTSCALKILAKKLLRVRVEQPAMHHQTLVSLLLKIGIRTDLRVDSILFYATMITLLKHFLLLSSTRLLNIFLLLAHFVQKQPRNTSKLG